MMRRIADFASEVERASEAECAAEARFVQGTSSRHQRSSNELLYMCSFSSSTSSSLFDSKEEVLRYMDGSSLYTPKDTIN
jgi:hypothetical protein